jgi:hypothetical protein
MWEEGERRRLGKTVVVEFDDWDDPRVLMLDRSDIFK